MGAYPLFCRRTSVCSRNDSLAGDVQTHGNFQYGHSPLYQLAQPAMGYQAALEPVRRFAQNQTLVDCQHAAIARGRTGGNRLHHPDRPFLPAHIGRILAYRFQLRHTRHRRRRILHARSDQPSASIVRGHPQHVLPFCHDSRPRASDHAGWIS